MKKFALSIAILTLMFIAGYQLPEARIIPVQGASSADWNARSFWYYPWGRSGTHKGIDIFAKYGQPVLAATGGLVVAKRYDGMGGNVILVLGAKWRFHYYAHLSQIAVYTGQWVSAGQEIGAVGDSGNAKGKQPHLHYAIRRLIPNPTAIDSNAPQGWRKMHYIDPGLFLEGG